jgi:hypothetical protein
MALLNIKGRGKLWSKFLGPIKILGCVGEVAYKLELPVEAKIHDVFHVGLLKPFRCELPTALGVPPCPHPSPIRLGRACLEPRAATKSRVARGKLDILVQWKGLPAVDANELIVRGGEMSCGP